ncbi:MAG: hypothetical protein OHK0039_21800 [Bacteroidia bacterium]
MIRLGAILAAAVAGIWLMQLYPKPDLLLARGLAASLAGLSLLVLAGTWLWGRSFAWRAIWLRWLWLRMARLTGSLRYAWLRGPWRLLLMYLLLLAFVSGIKQTLGQSASLLSVAKDAPWLLALGALGLGGLFVLAARARRQVLLGEFTDYTGQEALAKRVQAIPDLLRMELGRLRHLFEAGPQSLDIQEAAVAGRDIGSPVPRIVTDQQETGDDKALFSEVAADNKLELGPIKIPLKPLTDGLSRLLRGPRLRGSLHATGQGLLLEATLTSGGQHLAWTVEQQDIDMGEEAEAPDLVTRMTQQLAYRIFSDLEKHRLGTPSWRALIDFVQGLRLLNRARSQAGNKDSLLRQAERHFFRAYAYDSRFALSIYNMGVIHYQLGRYAAAAAAFRQALDIAPDLRQARYALAKALQGMKDYDAAHLACEALILDAPPDDPNPYNLLGVLSQQKKQGFDQEVVGHFGAATERAWRRLCLATLRTEADASQRYTAGLAVSNLAVSIASVHREHLRQPAGGLWRRYMRNYLMRLSRQAAQTSPETGDIWRERGKIALLCRRPRRATEACRFLVRQTHDAYSLAWLAAAYHAAGALPLADQTWQQVLADPQDAFFNSSAIYDFRRIWEQVRPIATADDDMQWLEDRLDALETDYLRVQEQVEDAWADAGESWEACRQEIDTMEAALGQATNDWQRAQLRRGIGLLLLQHAHLDDADRQGAHYQTAIAHIEAAIRLLAGRKRELASLGIYADLAEACLARVPTTPGDERLAVLTRAYTAITQALTLQPARARERRIAFRVFLANGDTDRALYELEMATSLDPRDFLLRQWWIELEWTRYTHTFDRQLRQTAARRLVAIFQSTIEAERWKFEQSSADTTETRHQTPAPLQQLAFMHYWLGRFQGEMREFARGIENIRAAIIYGYDEREGKAALIWLSLSARAYEQAELVFQELRAQGLLETMRTKGLEMIPLPGDRTASATEWVSWAYAYSALSLGYRGLCLEAAADRIAQGRKAAPPEMKNREGFDATCLTAQGLIELARAKNQPPGEAQTRSIAAAIDYLQAALAVPAAPDELAQAWHLLAQAYVLDSQRIDPKTEGAHLRWLESQAAFARERCRQCDLRGFYEVPASEPATKQPPAAQPPATRTRQAPAAPTTPETEPSAED